MSPELKSKLVEAHRSGDWETAAALSQKNEEEKRAMKMKRTCKRCQNSLSNSIRNISGYCRSCLTIVRNYGNAITMLMIMVLMSGCIIVTRPTPQAPGKPPEAPDGVIIHGTGGQVQLEWDYATNVTNTLAGFTMLAGTAHLIYDRQDNVGMNSLFSVSGGTATYRGTVANLTVGNTYYFSVTARGTNGKESGTANEVVYTVPTPVEPPTNAPNQLVIVSPQWATGIAGPWTGVPQWNPISFTNPAGNLFLMFKIEKQP